MLLGILLTFHIIVCIALIGVVLIQRSEGGALGMGGGPSGFMTARGAGDLLTRTTWILGGTFFVLSLLLTLLAGRMSGGGSVVDRMKIDSIDPNSLNRPPATAPLTPPAPATQAPAETAPAPVQSSALQAPTPKVRAPTATAPASSPAPIKVPQAQIRNPLLEGAEPAAPAPPTS